MIKEYVIEYFLRQDHTSHLTAETIVDFNYLEGNFFSSIQFIQMISDFESKFSIEFSNEQLQSQEFSIVGKLINLIEQAKQGK